MLTSLCRPPCPTRRSWPPPRHATSPGELVVTEAAVKQHLLRLYQKFRIPEGANRRTRLANEVIAMGLVRPLPPVHVPQGRPPMDGRVSGVRTTGETRRPGAPGHAAHGPGRPAHSTAGRRAS